MVPGELCGNPLAAGGAETALPKFLDPDPSKLREPEPSKLREPDPPELSNSMSGTVGRSTGDKELENSGDDGMGFTWFVIGEENGEVTLDGP